MKKEYVFYILFTLTTILLACTQNKKPNQNRSLPNVLDSSKTPTSSLSNASDRMKTINLKLGEETTIELRIQEGYTWYYEVKPEWVISMTEEYDAPNKSASKSGATETTKSSVVFKIKTLKKGEVSIRFYAIHAWEQKSKPVEEQFYTIKIE